MTYDCFTFFNELDILEMRLNILDPYVDFFVIVESKETFSGKTKPLYFAENKERFKKWEDKIIHIALEIPMKEFNSAFDRAYYQKETIKDALCFNAKANNEDIIYYGDVDEIWKPQNIKDDKVYNLEQINYCYYLNNRSSERWVGTIVGKWGTVKTNDLAYWRATHRYELPNGGWHFTNMGGKDQILKKLEAYDHQEYNNDNIKDNLEFNIENGFDYVGRVHDWQGKGFEYWIDESELPSYTISNKNKLLHLFK